MMKPTHQALEKFDNQHDFERMSADILNSLGYKDVVPIAPKGGGDGGRDITYTTPDGQKGLACVTLREDSDTKFKEDFEQRKKGDYSEYMFFTNRYLTAAQKLKYTKYCANTLGATFQPKDIEYLRSLLDSALQAIRRNYLHIDVDDTPTYQLRIVELRRYSAAKLLEAAKNSYTRRRQDFLSRSKFAGVMPSSIAVIGVKSTQQVLEDLEEYATAIEVFDQSLSKVLSFNIELVSDRPDTNVEVHIRPLANFGLSFDDRLIKTPDEPSENYLNGLIPAVPHVDVDFRDDDEFYARTSREGIKSNLKSINASQPKLVMDVTTFVVSPGSFRSGDTLALEAIIYSNKLETPQLAPLTIAIDDAELCDVE